MKFLLSQNFSLLYANSLRHGHSAQLSMHSSYSILFTVPLRIVSVLYCSFCLLLIINVLKMFQYSSRYLPLCISCFISPGYLTILKIISHIIEKAQIIARNKKKTVKSLFILVKTPPRYRLAA
jgi:hypothetical protein